MKKKFLKIIIIPLLGVLLLLGCVYAYLRVWSKIFRNNDFGITFKYPSSFELYQYKGSDHPYLYNLRFENKRLGRLIDIFGRVPGYPTYVEIFMNDKNCDDSLSYLINHPLRLFYKPALTGEVISGIPIYELKNVHDQYLYAFNKFACIEKGDKSIFIAGEPDVWKDGKLLENLQSSIVQRESYLLFKTIINSVKLE